MHELIFIRALRFLDCRRLLSTLIKFGTRTKPIASEAVDSDEVFDVIEKERSNRRLDRNSFHDGPFRTVAIVRRGRALWHLDPMRPWAEPLLRRCPQSG